MFKNEFQISYLLVLHFRDQLSVDQQSQLDHWKMLSDDNITYFNELSKDAVVQEKLLEFQQLEKSAEERVWRKTLEKIGDLNQKHSNFAKIPLNMKLWAKLTIAAMIIFTLGLGFWFYQNQEVPHDIATAKTAATLTLANGKKVDLSAIQDGPFAEQSGVTITKSAGGQLVYSVKKENEVVGEETRYNTLSTSNGEQYQLILPDGSTAYLNAGTSITFPVTFRRSARREIVLNGEAYFEVFKDKKHPFVVKTQGQEIQVLGTHFNVKNYQEEAGITTTLLEGSVRIVAAGSSLVLKPGQQSLLINHRIAIKEADVKMVMAWRTGKFIFDDESLENILHQITRWYNVEIIYVNAAPKDLHLVGTISRSKPLSAILNHLELTGKVKFKVEGRRVWVLPVDR